MSDDDLPPLVTVVKGAPTPEQLAALVTVVCSLRPLESADAQPVPPADGTEPALWGAPVVRGTPATGPGAWRASGLPQPPA